MMNESARCWKCGVCGYTHQGEKPPSECPVCGAPVEVFEEVAQEPEALRPVPAAGLKCMVCGFLPEDGTAPDVCPVCGAGSDCFEPLAATMYPAPSAGDGERVLVVGGGIAGLSTVEALRSSSPSSQIVLLSREKHLPYYRLNLTRYLAGEVTDQQLPMRPESWYAEKQIDLRLGAEVLSIDPVGLSVSLVSGETLPFDKLIITAGAHAFVPPASGASKEGVLVLRTVDDARCILDRPLDGARCVCVGGGLLGLEAAAALKRRGADVTVIEGSAHLLPRQLSPRGGGVLQEQIESTGIVLLPGRRVKEFAGDERVHGVLLDDGTICDTDFAVISAGVRPNVYLARQAGLAVNRGIVVDNYMKTSHPNIFAAGDVAEHQGLVYGIWPASQYQGTIAGLNAAGVETEFLGISRSNTLKVLNTDVVSIGLIEPDDGSYTVFEDCKDDHYTRFILRDHHLMGCQFIGDASVAPIAKKMIEDKADVATLFQSAESAADCVKALQEL